MIYNKVLSLDGVWFIHDDPDKCGFDNIRHTQDGFIPATVPGNIQGDLEDAHLLPPLRYGDIDERLYAVAMKDWWYKKEFELPADFSGKRLTLDFEGVDYECEIFLNGKRLMSHSGMFERFFIDVTDTVLPGLNTLYVRIAAMPEDFLPYIKGSDGIQSGVGTPYHFVTCNNYLRNRLKGLKSPANLSYDWATNVYTLGIWRSVTLRATGSARIDWMYVKPSFTLEDGKASGAKAEIILETDSLEAQDTEVTVEISGKGVDVCKKQTVSVPYGAGQVSVSVDVGNPELWWPVGYGEQPLYKVSVSLSNGDSASCNTAFREVEWTDCEGAPENFQFKYQLILNGLPIRTIGSNYEAPEIYFGRAGKRAVHYVKMAARANMNFLRLHGGSAGHNQYVYDAADKYGIMLSSEFPIGNCCIENDPELLDNLDKTCVNLVKQLRNHPSIIEWGGGNELEWYFTPDKDRTGMYRQEKAAYSADDTRLFRYTCPVPGSRHSPWTYVPDWHYKLYNLYDIGDNFKIAPNMRFGEFGVQTPSNVDVWYKDIPEPDRWPIRTDNPVLIRKNAVNAVFSPEAWFGMDIIQQLFGMPDSLEDAIKAGQFIGAEGLRYAMGALRAKDGRMGGFTNWDYNEPWPNAAGSFLIDYDGRPVMMYHFVKQALEPVSVQLKYDNILYDFIGDEKGNTDGNTAEIQVVSDKPGFNEEVKWECVLIDREGKEYLRRSGLVRPEYRKTVSGGSIIITPPEFNRFGPSLAELFLYDSNGEIISEKYYIFGAKGPMEPLRGLLGDQSKYPYGNGGTYVISGIYGGNIAHTSITASVFRHEYSADGSEQLTLNITNTGAMTALFIDIKPEYEYQAKLYVDNNFLSIPAGQSRKVKVTIDSEEAGENTLSLKQVGFVIDCFNAETVHIQPDSSALLLAGRHDQTTRGYSRTASSDGGEFTADGNTLDISEIPYLLSGKLTVKFDASSELPAKLLFHICDSDKNGLGRFTLKVNDIEKTYRIPVGMGVQDSEPYHLAYPASFELELPAGALKGTGNRLEIIVKDGWVTLDSISLTEEKPIN